MGLLSALRGLAAALTDADKTTPPSNTGSPSLLVDGATPQGGALWTRARMIVRAAGAIGTAFSEPGIDPTTGGLNVNIAGGSGSIGTVNQGTKTATDSNAWPVRLYNASAALLGVQAAAASLPVTLSTENVALFPASLGAKAAAASFAVTMSTENAALYPASLGTKAAASSFAVTLSTENTATLAAVATATKQDTGNTSLATIADAQPYLRPPGSFSDITPNDGTDITAEASIGLLCTVAGDLAIRGATTTGTTVTFPVIAGQIIPGAFSRVMAATTATVKGLAP